jgi:peptidase C13-like protein
MRLSSNEVEPAPEEQPMIRRSRRIVVTMLWCLLAAAIALVGCQSYGARLQTSPAGYRVDDASVPDSPFSKTHWKAILLSGDSSIRAFDNAVRDLAAKFRRAGVEVVAILSATSKERPGTHAGLAEAASELRPAEGEGCLLYATSHGTFYGLLLPRDAEHDILTPEELNSIVTSACGRSPTIIVISACQSGTFIRETTVAPNRILFSAANELRKSFGCRAERLYTYYDGCFIQQFGRVRTWEEFYATVTACVQEREAKLQELPSEPQAFFGRLMRNLPLPTAR